MSVVNLVGKNALVCGGTSGIGQGIAMMLAKSKANVTIVGRNAEMGAKIVEEMKSVGAPDGEYAFLPCDASLMAEIKKCCGTWKSNHTSLNYLILSQGIASVNGFTPTAEGIDQKLALHYYGRMMFIRNLLPVLNATADASEDNDVRVLSVLSGGVHSAAIYHDDLDLQKNFSIPNAANVAGFYNDLGLDKLASLNPKVTFIHAAPGVVRTAWGSGFPWYLRAPVRLFQMMAMSPEQCAQNMCSGLWNKCAKDPASNRVRIMSQSGSIGNNVTSMHTPEIIEEVWSHTDAMLGKYE